MYHYLMNADAAQERLNQMIDEANEYRRANQVERLAESESKIAAFMRSLSSKVQNALNSTANTGTTQTNDQPVKNSL